jgi:hypothetical protein
MKRNLNTFCKSSKFKEKNGILIVEMHFIGFFIALMIIKK